MWRRCLQAGPKIPAETPYSAQCWKHAVCGDWVVVRSHMRTGLAWIFPENREFFAKFSK
jgi:hypothetical protein